MTNLLFFCYLPGEWVIEREVLDKSASLSNAVAKGIVSISKKNTHILNYQESLARILHDGSIKYKFAGLVMLKSNFLQKFC